MIALLAAAAFASMTYRWFYVSTNLFIESEEGRIDSLLDRAAKAGYNGMVITDSKFESLSPYPDYYIARAKRILGRAHALRIAVIPQVCGVGWADALLSHNPNLVEAMLVRDVPFVVHGSEAKLESDPAVHLVNGDFSQAQGDKFVGWGFQDGIGLTTFADHMVLHGGTTSLRMDNPGKPTHDNPTGAPANCRIMQTVRLHPWRNYDFSVWVKSQDFAAAGAVRLLSLDAKGRVLSYQDIGVMPTQDWKRIDITFSSQDDNATNLYMGVWGGTTGRLWWADSRLSEIGLMNVVRRPGCPLSVVGESGMVYEEGRDFERVVDPKSGTVPWPGEFDVVHDGVALHLTPGSRIHDGARLRVSFFSAVTTDTGKAAICLSEPETRQIEDDAIRRVAALFGPDRLFFSHDEIRVMNWCDACRKTGRTPAQILDADVEADDRLAKALSPRGERFIWSDMFDPFHNAVEHYYLVNGDLRGSWLGLPKDLVIVNWNSGAADKSLPFFDKLGYRQILAGYYDGPVNSIKEWLAKARGLHGVSGVMYTTWQSNFRDLEAFAKAAWGG
jgi:hypothetical protein